MIETLDVEIWGRKFTLPIVYDCYEGEIITEAQIKAMDGFSRNPEQIEDAKEKVESFCRDDVLKDADNMKKSNIFSYIKPEQIFVKHEENPRIALMCKYRYDIEHGIAVVFSHKGEVTVGIQDIIL